MYAAELSVRLKSPSALPASYEALEGLLGALRWNGQVLGNEFLIARKEGALCACVRVPERGSLSARHCNKWVTESRQRLMKASGGKLRCRLLGRDPSGLMADRCRRNSCYILFTSCMHLDSPLRCGDCFHPVPLYRIPPSEGEMYLDIVRWQADYRACDSLWLNSEAGERFGMRQLSLVGGALSVQGRQVCQQVEARTGLPTYYFLDRYGRSTRNSEKERRCPECGGDWLLPKPLHQLFDFRCERCRLLSNVSWDAR